MFTIDSIIFIIALLLLYVILGDYLYEHKILKIIYSGVIVTSIMYIIGISASFAFTSQLFMILSITSIIILLVLIIIHYVEKLKG